MCGAPPEPGLKVLVAAAHPGTVEMVREALSRVLPGHHVQLFGSVNELAAVASTAPSLAVVDNALPGAVARLGGGDGPRADSATVLLVDPAELAPPAFEAIACADDIVLKPCRTEELAARVRLSLTRLADKRRKLVQAQALEDNYARQTEFLSLVSHEIRTPLSAIMSSAGILRRYGRERPESVERFAAIIQEESRRLTRLINNLLDLAKIEAGQVEWHAVPTRVAEFVELLEDSFAALIGERALTLEVCRAGGPEEIVADRDKIIQVLANLLSNAVKHSPEGAAVLLRCSGTESVLRIEVGDEGPGIPVGQEERIFGRFQQLEVGDERTGTGLGLTISRQIVEHHGGRVWAERNRGRGALFVVELPVGAAVGGGDGAV